MLNHLEKENTWNGKVFEIGFAKTGTTSLAEAAKILGYKVIHSHSTATDDFLMKISEGRVDFDCIEKYDYIGNLFNVYYEELDLEFPNSKFILTIREESEWADSMFRQFKKNPRPAKDAENGILTKGNLNRILSIGFPYTKNKEFILRKYRKHNRDVVAYFKGTNQLLVLDVTKNSWEPLCSFLGKKIPNTPFPHLNKSSIDMSQI